MSSDLLKVNRSIWTTPSGVTLAGAGGWLRNGTTYLNSKLTLLITQPWCVIVFMYGIHHRIVNRLSSGEGKLNINLISYCIIIIHIIYDNLKILSQVKHTHIIHILVWIYSNIIFLVSEYQHLFLRVLLIWFLDDFHP